MLEHEEERRWGVHVDHDVPPQLLEVLPHEEDEEATYQAALEQALQQALEASRVEKDAQWDGLERALALSATGDSIHSPLFIPPPPSLPIVEPKAEPEPMLEICPRGNNKLVIIIFPCS